MPSSFFDTIDDLPAMTLLPDVAKVLSASSYPSAPSQVSTSNRLREQLYGGLVATRESDREDEDDDNQDEHRPRKKARSAKVAPSKTSESVQEAPKRQRGRPKVSTKDETASERRRTQIRLAQRAYRNRKENTIIELSQKVESLQSMIKSLNAGFSQLRESLLTAGIVHSNSALAQQVNDLARGLSDALESTSPGTDKASESEDSAGQSTGRGREAKTSGSNGDSSVPLTLQGQPHPASSRPDVDIQSSLLGVGTDLGFLDRNGPNLTASQKYPASTTNYPTFSASTKGHVLRSSPQSSMDDDTASMSIERFPHKDTYTYSFQETTFARRLHRLCIEKAFQRILNPYCDPAWLLKTFKLTFNFSNRERIINAFKDILARGTDEPLENWRTPFIHVGGAGLHFPRRDADGNPVYPPNVLHPRHVATTWRIPDTETQPNGVSMEDILSSIGFDGEWYDCHDVEEYLKTKGIYPDPQGSFVVIDSAQIGLSVSPWIGTAGSVTSESSPRSYNSGQLSDYTTASSVLDDMDKGNKVQGLGRSIPLVQMTVDSWQNHQGSFDGSNFDFDFELSRGSQTNMTGGPRLLTIEIEKLLDRLSAECVCLGRAPGFRKQHVDDALLLAMQEAF